MKKILIGNNHSWNDQSIRIGDHHYAKLLVKQHWKVFWMSHPISPYHIFKSGNVERFKSWTKGVQKSQEVFFYTPFTFFPYYKKLFYKEWFGKNNLRFTIPSIKRILNKYHFLDVDILWITDLSMYYLTHIVRYKKMVLRLIDDIPMYENSPASIKIIQDELINKADYVVVTSKNLMKYQYLNNQNFYYVPNGVDVKHFQKKYKIPIEYQEIKSPRIIYLGGIYEWFDTELLKYIASKLANYNFILIGPSGIDLSDLKRYKNIFLLGIKKYNEIPAYLQYADVGIIPFKNSQLTRSVSPIKMFEYFAAGLPVVSTRIEEAESLNPPAYFTDEPAEFVKNLKESFREGKNKKEYFEFVNNNSWDSRLSNILQVLKS